MGAARSLLSQLNSAAADEKDFTAALQSYPYPALRASFFSNIVLFLSLGAAACGGASPMAPIGATSNGVRPVSVSVSPLPVPVQAIDASRCEVTGDVVFYDAGGIGGRITQIEVLILTSSGQEGVPDIQPVNLTLPPGRTVRRSRAQMVGSSGGQRPVRLRVSAAGFSSNVAAGPGSAQYGWVRADLAAHHSLCTIADWHHPLFSSSVNGNNSQMREMWRLLDASGTDIVLTGHDHKYERFAPQDADGLPSAQGLRECVVGTGGGTPYGLVALQPNSKVREHESRGVLKLTLRSRDYE